MERMGEESFVRDIVHSEQVANTLDLGCLARKEMPVGGICFPGLGVLAQVLGPVVHRVEGDGEQHQFLPQPLLKLPLEDAKVIRRAKTIFRQRAAGVDKVESHYFARELAKVQGPPLLVDEREVGDRLPDRQPTYRTA